MNKRACSSVVERHSDKVEVEGPIPSTRTKKTWTKNLFFLLLF